MSLGIRRALSSALGTDARNRAGLGAAAGALPIVWSRAMSSCKLFIGGLAWGVDEMTLKSAFESYGQVTEARVIIDRETGRSRGFGFVSYTNEEEAKAAMESMDGKDLGGRNIRVDYASDRPAAPRQEFNSSFNFNSDNYS